MLLSIHFSRLVVSYYDCRFADLQHKLTCNQWKYIRTDIGYKNCF